MKIQIEQLDLLRAWPTFTLRDGHYAIAVLVRLGQMPIGEVMLRPVRSRVVSHRRLRRRITRRLGDALLKHLTRDRLHSASQSLTPAALEEILSPAGLPAPLREAIIESQSRSDHPTPGVTIAVCTHDRAESLEGCIAHLRTLDYPDFEIMIVDHGGDAVPAREIADRLDLLYVRCQRTGVARARNMAIQHARSEWIAFIDVDARPQRSWLRELTRGAQDPNCRCVCGLVLPDKIDNAAEAALHLHGSAARRYAPAVFDRRFLKARVLHAAPTWDIGSSANLLLNTFFAEDIGAYDIDLSASVPGSASGGEDADLFHRVLRAGKTIRYIPQAIVHDHRRWTSRCVRTHIRADALGLAAYHARSFLKRADHRALLHLAWHQPLSLLRELQQALTLRSRYPFSLTLIELRATLIGPWRYAAAKAHRALKKLFGAKHGALRPVHQTAPIDVPPRQTPARPHYRPGASRAA